MSVEVVCEEVVELVSSENVGAGVQHSTARQILVNGGVLPPVQLVHHHLPHRVGPGGAALQVAVAPVGHLEVHGVGPQGRVLQGSCDGGVVEEALLLHHGELVVATDPEVGSSQTDHGVVFDLSKLVNDQPGAGHLPGPVLHTGVRPEALVTVVSDGVSSDLMAQSVHVGDGGIVGVVVRYEKCGFNITSIGVPPLFVKDFTVQVNVSNIDGVIEGEGDHLGDSVTPVILGAEVSGNLRAVLGAETVGEFAESFITGRGSVGVGFTVYNTQFSLSDNSPDLPGLLTTDILVRAVVTFLHSVTEQTLGDAGAVSTGQFVGVLTERLVRYQQRFYLFLFCLFITIFHSPLPVTGLLLQVKGETWGTSDSLETLAQIRGKRWW